MSEATEVPMVCVDCGGSMTDDEMISIASRNGIVEYEHMNFSQCIASLGGRITLATKRAEAAEAERDALRKVATLVQKYRLEGCVLVPVSRELLSENWSNQPLCIRINDNGDGTHTMILRRPDAALAVQP